MLECIGFVVTPQFSFVAAQWPSCCVSVLRLGGRGFNPRPGHTNDNRNKVVAAASLLGIQGWTWGVKLPPTLLPPSV